MTQRKNDCSDSLKDITAEVWMKDLSGRIGYLSSRAKIHRKTLTTGVIIADGRPVVKQDGQWIYEVK